MLWNGGGVGGWYGKRHTLTNQAHPSKARGKGNRTETEILWLLSLSYSGWNYNLPQSYDGMC